ncbi:MAG: hypothetical protein A2493_02535 [Candidatus Magasanikbacteria bacterium RIFOXYC12_FULL_33_11]|uniref:Uncharacterized protein n=1 Tax=Candidatus Magasanikbacteria bacterium RIFOXYC12_FULL_33_11 TaxID=1798701 RepID=A0A1F6NPK3_9BACT|nr:MAG: hypothetical protein A2493_02535 [Candidatus Magasanikbacteria bacterium RIFOXYC12_FULL_33_11]
MSDLRSRVGQDFIRELRRRRFPDLGEHAQGHNVVPGFTGLDEATDLILEPLIVERLDPLVERGDDATLLECGWKDERVDQFAELVDFRRGGVVRDVEGVLAVAHDSSREHERGTMMSTSQCSSFPMNRKLSVDSDSTFENL